jgi:hypothetical protein
MDIIIPEREQGSKRKTKIERKVSNECIDWVKNINKCLETCNTFDECDKKCNIYKICNVKK